MPIWSVYIKGDTTGFTRKWYKAKKPGDAATQYALDGRSNTNPSISKICNDICNAERSDILNANLEVTDEEGYRIPTSKVYWFTAPVAAEVQDPNNITKEEQKDYEKAEEHKKQEDNAGRTIPNEKPTSAKEAQDQYQQNLDKKHQESTNFKHVDNVKQEILKEDDDWEKHYGKHGQDWFEGKDQDQNQEPEQETKPYKGYQKLWDFGIRYRDEKINPTIPDEDLDNTEWNFKHGKTGTAVQAAMYAKTGQVVDKRKWIRNWIEEYNAKTKNENKSALGQTMFLLEKWFGGEVKVALPFIGEWGKHPLSTGLKGISDCIMSISASFNIALDILHQIPEWLRLTNIFLRDMEAYQKEIISMLAPTMTLINEDLIPYINQQKEIADKSFQNGLPIYTEPNSPEQLKSVEALYTLINNPFTGYKYKGMLEHARLRHYQDVTKTGFADGWAMLDYVLNNPEGGGMQVRTPGTIEPEQELAKILPPEWYLSGNAPKGLKEAFKTEHKAGHAQIKDINRRGGFE